MQDPNFQRKVVNVGSKTFSCYPISIDQLYKIQQDKVVVSSSSTINSYKQQRNQNQLPRWVNIEEKAEQEVEQCKFNQNQQNQEEQKVEDFGQKQQQMQKIISIKKSEEFTHFISIPLNYHEFLDSVLAFQTDILYNIDEKYQEFFTQSAKSHITLCMLKLADKNNQQKAINLLQESQAEIKEIINNEPLDINIQGLGYFSTNKEQSKPQSQQISARVVYTKVLKGSSLTKIRKIADMLIKKLLKAELVEEKDLQASHIIYEKNSNMYELKQIHITLMKIQKTHSNDQNEFEVTEIFKRHQNFKFASMALNKIDISIRGEEETDGFYKSLYRIQLL